MERRGGRRLAVAGAAQGRLAMEGGRKQGKDLGSGAKRLQRQVGGAVSCAGVTQTAAGVGRERHLSGGSKHSTDKRRR